MITTEDVQFNMVSKPQVSEKVKKSFNLLTTKPDLTREQIQIL
jgi:hypothetical protein